MQLAQNTNSGYTAEELRQNRRARRLAVWRQVCVHAVIVILLFFVFIPVYFLVIKSFKSPEQEIASPFAFTSPIFWENYKLAWLFVKGYILNTVVIAVGQTLGTLIVCSAASYAFIRYKFPGKNVLFIVILSFMMVPGILTLIPQYQMVLTVFNMKNSYLGVILPAVAGAVPMGVFLLKTFFAGLPQDLFEAAELDGASKFRQYIMIALPLSVPILSTLGIMQLIGAWNDLLWPQLILQEESMHTITIGLAPFTESYYNEFLSLGVPFAGYVIVSLPLLVVFFFASKQFIRGLTSGAFKM